MREIKFRAWDVENKKMISGDNLAFEDYAPLCDLLKDTDEMKFMQYTGLKDKNGKEIYEGDIYHQGDENILYVVEWNDTGLMGKQKGTFGSYAGLSYWRDKIEVIGNIFEKPKLVESVKE